VSISSMPLTSHQKARRIFQEAFNLIQKSGADDAINNSVITRHGQHHGFANHCVRQACP
jgi:hypothetical protein